MVDSLKNESWSKGLPKYAHRCAHAGPESGIALLNYGGGKPSEVYNKSGHRQTIFIVLKT